MYQLRTTSTAIALASLLFLGCEEFGDCERGRGPIVNQQLELSSFHSLKLSGNDKLYILQGPPQEVRVEGEQNIIDRILLQVDKGVWDIRTRGCVSHHTPLVYYVTLPDIRQLSVSGSGDIIGENTLTSPEIELEVTGSGSITVDVDAVIDAEVTGSGTITLSGIGDAIDVEVTGSGECDAFALQAADVTVDIEGSGDAYVTALNRLDVDIRGSGNVYYRGIPAINSSISGSGKLIKRP